MILTPYAYNEILSKTLSIHQHGNYFGNGYSIVHIRWRHMHVLPFIPFGGATEGLHVITVATALQILSLACHDVNPFISQQGKTIAFVDTVCSSSLQRVSLLKFINTLSAKDGDLRLSASNACLPKTEISVFGTECVFFTSTCYKLHNICSHCMMCYTVRKKKCSSLFWYKAIIVWFSQFIMTVVQK